MSNTRFRANLLSLAVKHGLIETSLLTLGMSISVMATAETSMVNNVQTQKDSLAQAINQFAEKSEILINYDAKLVEGKKSSILNGSYNLENGFATLLTPHGLQLKKTSSGYTIVERPQVHTRDMGQLKTIDVTATGSKNSYTSTNPNQLPTITLAANSHTTEGTSSYTTGKMRTATKLDLSIRDTPQSVTVISHQMLEDKKIDDFQTLMNQVTGISSNQSTDARGNYYSRGFSVDYYQLDGIPVFQNGYSVNSHNMDKFDRIEVVKGANGLTTGAGNPAASLNLVRKHANSTEFAGNITASAGSWDTYKLLLDVSTPLNQEGTVRGRLVTSYKDAKSFKEQYSRENSLVYGVIDMDLSDNTVLSVGTSYELDDRDGDINRLPAFYSDGTRTNFARSKNYALDWESWDTEITSYFADIKHVFENNISINMLYTHNEINTKDRLNANIFGDLNQDGSGLNVTWFHAPQEIKEDNVDLYTSIPFNFIDREHELIAGIQYNKNNAIRKRGGSSGGFLIDNFFSENGSGIAQPNLLPTKYDFEDGTKQTAAYINGKFEIFDGLKLISGARLTNWEYYSRNAARVTTASYKNNDVFTPFFGLVYDIGANHSIYTSYTDIFKPQNYKDQSGTLLEPVEGNNYELGIKGEYFDGALNAGLTLFKVKQDNVAERIENVFVDGTGGTENAYRGVKGVTSEGFEIDLAGKINDHWDISAGFSHFEAKSANNIRINTTSPRNNLNLFTKYTIDNLSVGAGVNWRSKSYSESGDKRVDRADYMLLDLMASYKISKNLSSQLNINNLLDKKYYSGFGTDSYSYGDPRNATIGLKYQF